MQKHVDDGQPHYPESKAHQSVTFTIPCIKFLQNANTYSIVTRNLTVSWDLSEGRLIAEELKKMLRGDDNVHI